MKYLKLYESINYQNKFNELVLVLNDAYKDVKGYHYDIGDNYGIENIDNTSRICFYISYGKDKYPRQAIFQLENCLDYWSIVFYKNIFIINNIAKIFEEDIIKPLSHKEKNPFRDEVNGRVYFIKYKDLDKLIERCELILTAKKYNL